MSGGEKHTVQARGGTLSGCTCMMLARAHRAGHGSHDGNVKEVRSSASKLPLQKGLVQGLNLACAVSADYYSWWFIALDA